MALNPLHIWGAHPLFKHHCSRENPVINKIVTEDKLSQNGFELCQVSLLPTMHEWGVYSWALAQCASERRATSYFLSVIHAAEGWATSYFLSAVHAVPQYWAEIWQAVSFCLHPWNHYHTASCRVLHCKGASKNILDKKSIGMPLVQPLQYPLDLQQYLS